MKQVLLIAMFVAIAIPAFAEGTSTNEIGRYQLVYARILVHSANRAEEQPILLKIDTASGRVWKFHSTITMRNLGGKVYPFSAEGWMEVSKDWMEEIQAHTLLEKQASDQGVERTLNPQSGATSAHP